MILKFNLYNPFSILDSSYTLFPLLLLLDAAVDCRSVQKGKTVTQNVSRISDAVAEGVLQCLEELLSKCRLGSVGQVRAIVVGI